jgi:hypothetical protein
MGRLFSVVVTASLLSIAPAGAFQDHCPGMHEDPLATLDECVTHHYEAGEIEPEGVYRSLLGKALRAQEKAARGDIDAAMDMLLGFVEQVNDLSGVRITGSAVHLADHAMMAIEQLGG